MLFFQRFNLLLKLLGFHLLINAGLLLHLSDFGKSLCLLLLHLLDLVFEAIDHNLVVFVFLNQLIRLVLQFNILVNHFLQALCR